MKIRNGFVSNSSSSSFIIIMKKDAFDKTNMDWNEISERFDSEIEDFEAEGYGAKVFGEECYILAGHGQDAYCPSFVEEEVLPKLEEGDYFEA